MITGFYTTAYGSEIIKDPDETISYSIGWVDRLTPGATVTSAVWTVPAGLTQISSAINSSPVVNQGRTHPIGTVTSVLLQGGTLGTRYTVTCHASCSNFEILEASFIVLVRSK